MLVWHIMAQEKKKNCCEFDICVENTAYFIICKDVRQQAKQQVHPAEFTVCSHTAGCRPSTRVTQHFPDCVPLVGLVVKASTSGAEDPGFESRLRRGLVIAVT